MSTPTASNNTGRRIHCTNCRRKKVKCDQQLPCQRCIQLKLKCDAPFSPRYKAKPDLAPTTKPSETTRLVESPRFSESAETVEPRRTAEPVEPRRTVCEAATATAHLQQQRNWPAAHIFDPKENLALGVSRTPEHSVHSSCATVRLPLSLQPILPRTETAVLGIPDLLNTVETPITSSASQHSPTQTTITRVSLPQLRFFRFSLKSHLLREYIQSKAPEILEFNYDGFGYICSLIHLGIQFQLSVSRFGNASKVWLDRSYVLTEILENIQQSSAKEGLVFALINMKGEGIVLPVEVGDFIVRWQRPYDLLRIRSWESDQ
ncbi:hypothetical protein QBC43DRAFT_320416 [Cladorrhinum sp. PSN259]|nr:hypothetical protein QBC43DRAFT_320416 [Cladorrhinum sp. PSN259]